MVFTAEERRERHRLAVRRHRARENPEEAAARRRRERERYRRAHPFVGVNGERQPVGELHHGWLDGAIPRFRPVSSRTKDGVLHDLRLKLGPAGMDETTCAVYDCSKLRKFIHMIPIADTDRFQQLRTLLSCDDEDLPMELIANYNCSGLFENLSGMLLSKRGVHSAGYLQICDDCNGSLLKNKIPKFAIKNGFYVGTLPARFVDATLPERMMTQIVSIIAVTRVMRGGAHRAIRSHCLAFDSTPGPAAALLPSSIRNNTSYRVVLAGPFTTEQQARVRQMHLVRRQVVEDLLAFYQQHNPIYDAIDVDCSGLAADTVAEHLICEEEDANIEADNIFDEGDRVGGVAEPDGMEAETDVVERRVVFISEDREVTTQNTPHAPVCVEELPTQHTAQPQFLVRHSSQFATNDKALFARMFPHLFPYGRGHPGERRHVQVSLEACIRHYCMLSSRRFAEDELFVLVSFDFLSVQRMYLQVTLKCQRNPALFQPYSAITEELLTEALRENELRRQGRTAMNHDNHSIARNFFKTVELSSGVMWGSDAERAQCRRRAFAYQTRFGQPALFVTLTPNVAESFVMAEYCGITSVDTLFDAALADPLGRSAMHCASMRNDIVSARLFVHHIDAFIEHVLGIAPKLMKTKPFDGLFGEVKAYFGMVETQGGGTLHAHFLVWLANSPPNSVAFHQAVAVYGDQYCQDIASFTDGIVTTSLPLHVSGLGCDYCQRSFADLEVLPIPSEAYENPNKDRGRVRGEPKLVRCSGCNAEMSSQHVLRGILLQNRPSSWPPLLRPYSLEELDAAVKIEMPCRGSIAAAKSAVFRRDIILTTSDTIDDDDTYGAYLRTLNEPPYRFERRQNDAFCNDKVAQAVVTLPPSVDDERWAPHAASFAVSMLVFLLNLHWWSHVGSCFKSSRAASPGQCRYRFPRPRVAHTSCSSAGVQLARRAPFEYINGYSATMMLTFKCNHDIQVLIGGLEALLRIYYATKYVTKLQNIVDSVTAVALAAFKRREQRELQGQTPQADHSTVGRRRVSSLVFALTNRREIAGPLAALYLLRGSCAFMSTPCTLLPLKDVLRELVNGDTHSCNLVEVREGDSSVTFRAASFLDDYIFRPLAIDHMCLYEFTMMCFRRKKTKSMTTFESFLPGHPLQSTHCVAHHRSEVIPVITGVRMPYLNSETPRNLVSNRSQCALVMFKPFRNVQDLVEDSTSEDAWIQAYFQWESTRTGFVREIMANMDDYYLAKIQANEGVASDNDEVVDPEDDSDELVGTRGEVDAAIDSLSGDSTTPVGRTDDFIHLFDDGDSMSADGPSLPIFPTNRPGAMVNSAMHRELLAATAESTVHTAIDLGNHERALGIPLDELQQWVKNSATDEADIQLSERFANQRPAVVIELLQSALEADSAWSPPNQQIDRRPLGTYSTISQVSTAFTLNRRQHAAFYLITSALLRRFLRQQLGSLSGSGGYRSSDYETHIRDDQLLMFLGGPGGTGKSRVIDSVDAFCSSWFSSNSIMKAALTGKAATLIGGRTLASFMVRLEHTIQEKMFAPMDLLVIDEVSMMSKAEWLKLDKLLRRYTQIENISFGGVHVVLVGDFLQLPPVKSDPIYVSPIDKAKPSTADLEGFELWRKIRTVVILDESVRFRNDPEWGVGCQNARLGIWTPEFVEMINRRVIQSESDSSQSLQDDLGSSAVFVTPENASRLAINNAFITETASMLPNNVYPVRVVANFKGGLNGLSLSDIRQVLSLPDNRFGRLAPYLDLVDGMPIQVTQNVATAKGIANGTLGRLEYVHFPAGTQFRLVRDGGTATIVQLPSHSPDYAVIRVPRPQATAIEPGVDPELFPIFFATEAYSKTTVKLAPAPNGQPRSITIRPQQFPFVCAVGSTVYKVQGETLESMVVMDWKSTHAVVNKPQQTYLLVSRVTTRNGLIALKPFTAKLAAWSKPPKHALQEEERLHHLSDDTLASFHLPVTAIVSNSSMEIVADTASPDA